MSSIGMGLNHFALIAKTATKMGTNMTARTTKGDGGIKTLLPRCVGWGVFISIFLGQWQRQWHSVIDDGKDDDKDNGKDIGR